jgi:PAS domain-containing protein
MKPDTDRKTGLEDKQNIETSELRYRRLFEAAQDGILLLNAETGMITDVNPFLVKMLGYTREEIVEKRLWEVGAFRISKPARRPSKLYNGMNTFATRTCRLERKTAS